MRFKVYCPVCDKKYEVDADRTYNDIDILMEKVNDDGVPYVHYSRHKMDLALNCGCLFELSWFEVDGKRPDFKEYPAVLISNNMREIVGNYDLDLSNILNI